MSISLEKVEKYKNQPAIFCCQRKKGITIGEADLEDPEIVEDLIDSSIVSLSDDGLTIGQVIGCTLIKDCDALTPITKEVLNGVNEIEKDREDGDKVSETASTVTTVQSGGNGMIHISIDKLEGLKLDLPVGAIVGSMPIAKEVPAAIEGVNEEKPVKVLRGLTQKSFRVNGVEIGEHTSFEKGVLTINKILMDKALESNPLVKKLEMDIIAPDAQHVYTDTIMDIIPVATKVEGELGEGLTHMMEGVVFCLTGVDEDGVQVHEFGSCEGYIDEKIAFGRPGCPDPDDIIVRVKAVIQRGTGMERRGPLAAHTACDVIIQDIREVLKGCKESPKSEATYEDVQNPNLPRVVIVKEIMGQGAMHDNILVPIEPAGVLGGQKNVDLGNVPVMLSPNEVKDGGIHALTCIGPATKEMTRHYFREPLVQTLVEDNEVNLVGVIFIGSPQVNDEKMYVSRRLGKLIETLDLDGAIVTTEGFGNNHIDFAANIEQIGKRGVPVVGMTFSAYQGQLVVGNQYMDAMIELNKDDEGFENEVLACSSIVKADADRALMMLKTKMAGIEIEKANRKWSNDVIVANQKIVDAL